MWNVSHFESHFASLNSDLVRLVRVEAAPLARPNLRVAKIVAQTDVRVTIIVLKTPTFEPRDMPSAYPSWYMAGKGI